MTETSNREPTRQTASSERGTHKQAPVFFSEWGVLPNHPASLSCE